MEFPGYCFWGTNTFRLNSIALWNHSYLLTLLGTQDDTTSVFYRLQRERLALKNNCRFWQDLDRVKRAEIMSWTDTETSFGARAAASLFRRRTFGRYPYPYTEPSSRLSADIPKPHHLNKEISESFKVYPNPSSGMLTVEFSSPLPGELILFNSVGSILLSVSHQAGVQKRTLNMEDLPGGIYLLRYKPKFGEAENKVIILQH